MKRTILALSLVAALGFSNIALAQSAPMVAGTVQKIDASAGKITLKHGPIPNLDMGGMTMVFKAGDASMLGQVKPGDKVRFAADRVNGQLTVTRIEK